MTLDMQITLLGMLSMKALGKDVDDLPITIWQLWNKKLKDKIKSLPQELPHIHKSELPGMQDLYFFQCLWK